MPKPRGGTGSACSWNKKKDGGGDLAAAGRLPWPHFPEDDAEASSSSLCGPPGRGTGSDSRPRGRQMARKPRGPWWPQPRDSGDRSREPGHVPGGALWRHAQNGPAGPSPARGGGAAARPHFIFRTGSYPSRGRMSWRE